MKITDTIIRYGQSDNAKFHMPGHKGKDAFCPAFDITELAFSDDLHEPRGIIAELMDFLAKTYRVKHSFLSVNGSTGGILAMFLSLAMTKPNPKVIIVRDCHKAVISGAVLSAAECVGIYPSDEIGFSAATAICVERALEQYPADAVFITSPTYFGACADVREIAKVVHSHGAMLLVDSAHGAAFEFSDALPPSPASFCDMCVMSTHKTLASMTQSAILHLNDCAVSAATMQSALSLVESSSPSYPLMASIENGVNKAKNAHPMSWDAHVRRVLSLRKRLSECGAHLFAPEDTAFDPTRIFIFCDPFFESGFALASALCERGILLEMADASGIVLITTPFDEDVWYERLLDAFSHFCRVLYAQRRFTAAPRHASQPVIPRNAVIAPCETVSLKNAAGRICAQCLGIYPPGISVLFPGETIIYDDIISIEEALKLGARGIDPQAIRVRCF